MPPSPWPYLDHPGPLAFAHRGGALDAPENTLAAFEATARLGYRHVETDARLTADGVAVAFHDDDLTRLAGRPARISGLTWKELSTVRIGGEPVPRLDDLLGTLPTLRFNIDPKHDAVVDAVVDAVRRTGALDRVAVAAFSGRRLRRVRRLLGPRLCTALSPAGIAGLRLTSIGVRTRRPAAPIVQVPVRGPGRVPIVDTRLVTTAHRLGLQVHVWTVDDPAEMHRLLDLGVDGLMTDRPVVLRDVLRSRGEWD